MKVIRHITFIFFFMLSVLFNLHAQTKTLENEILISGEKKISTGLLLAVGNTVIPTFLGAEMIYKEYNEKTGLFLLSYGALFGPSSGNFYAADYKRGFIGAGIRTASWLLVSTTINGGSWDENGSNKEEVMIFGALLLSVGTSFWNILAVPSSVRNHNSRHQQKYSINPLIDSSARNVGVQLTMLL